MHKQNVETVVQAGLGIILVTLFLLSIVGMYQMRDTNRSMSELVHTNQSKVEFAHQMRDAIRLREIGLNKMLALEDAFAQEEELIRFYENAGVYRIARLKLLELPMDNEEHAIHEQLTSAVRIAQPLNDKAAEQIADGTSRKILKESLNAASRQQQVLLGLLNNLVGIQIQRARNAVVEGGKNYDHSLYIVIIFGTFIIIGALLIVRKVSKYVASKNQELMKKNSQLAEATIKAQAASKTKSTFLATMSHEIRTPLTAIIGFSEVMLESDQTLEDRVKAIKTINSSGKHLLKIINDVLDLSKIEANKLELENVPLSPIELIADVVALIGPLASAKGLILNVRYDLPIPALIHSDSFRLKQIVINLVSNAVKFTESGHIIITASYDVNSNQMGFTINDSGIGMTEKQKDLVFEAFRQADSSTSRRYGGTGLGLSLSKDLAQKMGGDITVESLLNTGSQFKLTVDSGDVADGDFVFHENELTKATMEEDYLQSTDKFSGKVLLCEDNFDNQRLITHFIRKLGPTVDVADNGQIGISMVYKGDYDLVFMDMQMPMMSGVEATQRLREKGYTKPIVALTANAMQLDREDCLSAGCDDFITKPINRKELQKIISRFLQKDRAVVQVEPQIVSDLILDDPELAHLVAKFCKELPANYSDICELEKNKDWAGFSSAIHQLKGLGGGMGYPILTQLTGKIEFQMANEDYKTVHRLVSELGSIVQRISLVSANDESYAMLRENKEAQQKTPRLV